MHKINALKTLISQKEMTNNEYTKKTTKILRVFFVNSTNTNKDIDSDIDSGIESEISTKSPKSKFENDSPNEFTNGNSISFFEIALIIVILLLWLFSLRKFLKKFEKLRFTHYREITQKYRLHEPQNLNQVRVCRKQTDSVIYSRDPIKRLSIYPTAIDDEKQTLKTKLSKAKLISSDIRIYESNENDSISVESLNNFSKFSSLDAKPSTKRRTESKLKKNTSLEPFVKRSNNFLDPNVIMIPSLVRSSLLDLHRRSVENLSIGMKAIINENNTSVSNPNIKNNASSKNFKNVSIENFETKD
jgi:hypothetical protein